MSPPAPGHRILPCDCHRAKAKAPLPSSSRHRTGRRAGQFRSTRPNDDAGLTVLEDRPQKSCGSAPASHWLSALPASAVASCSSLALPPSSPARTSGPEACAKSIRPAVHPFPFSYNRRAALDIDGFGKRDALLSCHLSHRQIPPFSYFASYHF